MNTLRARTAICRAKLCVTMLLFAGALLAAESRQEASALPGMAILATNGQSDWKIILRADASGPEILAAGELAKYVRAIAQADIPILKGSSPGAHIIGIDSGAGELDGFDLAVTTNRITIHGHTPRGALHGVYQLLEDLGCRWYYPGSLGEVVPAVPALGLTPKTTRQTASFRERSVMLAYPFYYDRFEEWIDVLAKQRINNLVIYGQSLDWWKSTRAKYLPLLQARGMILEFGGHILPTFVPRVLFPSHPEYFRMNEQRQRTNDYNFCPSSAALEVLRKGTHDYFAQLPEFAVWACRCIRT